MEKDFANYSDDIRWQLIKDKLVKDHELKVTEEEIVEFAKQTALMQFQQYGMMNVPEEHLENYAQQILQNLLHLIIPVIKKKGQRVETVQENASQVASLAIDPLERMMREIPGVKHISSASERERGMVTVRFIVGENLGPSIVKVHDKLQSNLDKIPPGVSLSRHSS